MFESYYGSYRTETFAERFPTFDVFKAAYAISKIPQKLKDPKSLETIYYLLYAKYGNSHFANNDLLQQTYKIFSTIFMYGPTWETRLHIQDTLRDLDEAEIMAGGKAIYNHAFNPSTDPSTSTLEELLTINDQNTTNYKKSKIEGYALLLDLLETDVTNEFIAKFKKIFITFVSPDYPLLYETEVD